MKQERQLDRGLRVLFRARDFFIIGLLLLVAVVIILVARPIAELGVQVAAIYHKDRLIDRIELKQGVERDFSYPENPAVIFRQYADGTIAFLSSDCPDRICVRTGRIGKSGVFAACVPNHFLIVIERADQGEGMNDVDLIA